MRKLIAILMILAWQAAGAAYASYSEDGSSDSQPPYSPSSLPNR